MNKRTELWVTITLVVGAVGLGSGMLIGSRSRRVTPPPAAASASFDQADVTFALGMIPHHQQAIEMASLAPERAVDPTVRTVAASIAAAQTPEITELRAYLKTYGAVEVGSEHAQHLQMAGVASAADVAALGQLNGRDFDRRFVELMIAHHQGAITMANAEIASGSDHGLVVLARKVIEAQHAEVTQMQTLALNP